MRQIAARLREFANNRRYATRYPVRLPFSIVSAGTKARAINASRPLTLDGYTYDISSTGVGLIASTIRIGGSYLVGSDCSLDLTLRLPKELIQMLVNPVRYEKLDEAKDEIGYLIGVNIIEISNSNSTKLNAYLRTIR